MIAASIHAAATTLKTAVALISIPSITLGGSADYLRLEARRGRIELSTGRLPVCLSVLASIRPSVRPSIRGRRG